MLKGGEEVLLYAKVLGPAQTHDFYNVSVQLDDDEHANLTVHELYMILSGNVDGNDVWDEEDSALLELSQNPIDVAKQLIDMVDRNGKPIYSIDDLEDISTHLAVYCARKNLTKNDNTINHSESILLGANFPEDGQ